jgi:hypothetical protein
LYCLSYDIRLITLWYPQDFLWSLYCCYIYLMSNSEMRNQLHIVEPDSYKRIRKKMKRTCKFFCGHCIVCPMIYVW